MFKTLTPVLSSPPIKKKKRAESRKGRARQKSELRAATPVPKTARKIPGEVLSQIRDLAVGSTD